MASPTAQRLCLTRDLCERLTCVVEHEQQREACGCLLGHARKLLPLCNTAAHGRKFSISYYEYQRAERQAEQVGLDLVALYHSHPSGRLALSELDKLSIGRGSIPWVIVTRTPTQNDCFPIACYAPPDGARLPLRIL
jgi:proteasome lid subunit RPN8/RPN11